MYRRTDVVLKHSTNATSQRTASSIAACASLVVSSVVDLMIHIAVFLQDCLSSAPSEDDPFVGLVRGFLTFAWIAENPCVAFLSTHHGFLTPVWVGEN